MKTGNKIMKTKNPMTKTHYKIVLGGCGHSAKSVEFNALVVTSCIVGAILVLAIIFFCH